MNGLITIFPRDSFYWGGNHRLPVQRSPAKYDIVKYSITKVCMYVRSVKYSNDHVKVGHSSVDQERSIYHESS